MNHQYAALSFSFLFLLIGFVCADSVSSSIVCNGASWVSSSVFRPGTSLSQSLFTTDSAVVLRDMVVGEKVQAKTLARSAGPMGIDEYSSQSANQTDEPGACLFDLPKNQTLHRHETRVLGLLDQGIYSSSRTLDTQTRFLVEVNGTGIILTRAESTDSNQTLTHASDVAGAMNMSEIFQFGVHDGY